MRGRAGAAAATGPAPAPAPLPEQPLRLSADALFGFDSAVLSAEGQQAVQGILAQVREAAGAVDRVTGYTDRIGSASYNQALSQRRAEAVRSAGAGRRACSQHQCRRTRRG
jgi:outer membrane protein OmpA-like peptidoglycan-associated protein